MDYKTIKSICNHYHIYNWRINDETGLIDVDGDVDLKSRNLTKLPLKFGMIKGYFNCGLNRLKTLENCPTSVWGEYFSCHNNLLTSLDNDPLIVIGNYYCYSNNLKTNYTECNIGGDFYTTTEENGLKILKDLRTENFNDWRINKRRSIKLNKILKKGAT